MNFKSFTTIITLLLCALAAQAQPRTTHGQYIETYKDIAVEDQEVYGIPASIKMAQALLESDCGNSRLALEANNHFGIKCKRDWTGPTISHDDDAPGECFRKYASARESFRDHSEFLDKSPRYAKLFELDITDYKGWARELKAAGYATNPRYAELLIKMIEDHELYLLDTQDGLSEWARRSGAPAAVEPATPAVDHAQRPDDGTPKIDIDNYIVSSMTVGGYQVYVNNGSEFVIANPGDTYESVAEKTKTPAGRLRKYNEVGADAQPRAGGQVYLRPKAAKVSNGRVLHTAKAGETVWSVSQAYGIKVKKLAKLNQTTPDAALTAGQQIRLM